MLSIGRDGRISPDGQQLERLLRHVAFAIEEAARQAAYRKGGRSFWRAVGDSVMTREGTGGDLAVGAWHHAAGFKHRGGVIAAPGRGPGALGRRVLAIPVGKAREHRWSTVDARQHGFRLFRAGDLLLGQRGKRGKATPLFALRRRVVQRPDPWFPEGAELERVVRDAIDTFTAIT